MKNVPSVIAFCLLVLAISAFPVTHQDAHENNNDDSSPLSRTDNPDSPYGLEAGVNEFSVWTGGAFNATSIFGGLREEETKDRQFFIVGLRYGRILAVTKRFSFEYFLDIIPVAVALNTVVTRDVPPGDSGSRGNVYGYGASPLGFKILFGRQRRVMPFASVNGGFLYFKDPVPLPQSAQLNFTFEVDGGIQIFSRSRRAVTLGVKFHHLSNGGRSQTNRGLNAFCVFAGFSIFR